MGQSGIHDDPENLLRANLSGWTLVRALAPGGSRGHPATDDLAGTDVYGDPSVSAASGGTWSIDFERALPGYGEVLIMLGGITSYEEDESSLNGCGEKWVVVSKEELKKKSTAATMSATKRITALGSSASKLRFEFTTNMNNPNWRESTPIVSGETVCILSFTQSLESVQERIGKAACGVC